MDLFSFLDGIPPDDAEDTQNDQMDVDPSSKKRKATPPISSLLQDGQDSFVDDQVPSVRKKPRMASPAPLVVDEFETEAKREVEASAGLTGSNVEAGSRLELRHQV
jgi:ATP-dependent RNA helicase DOB1